MTEARVTSLADGAGHTALRGLPAVWLRANCPCADCRDPGSGQRLVAVTDLPADVTVAGVLAPPWKGSSAPPAPGPFSPRAGATGTVTRAGRRGAVRVPPGTTSHGP